MEQLAKSIKSCYSSRLFRAACVPNSFAVEGFSNRDIIQETPKILKVEFAKAGLLGIIKPRGTALKDRKTALEVGKAVWEAKRAEDKKSEW